MIEILLYSGVGVILLALLAMLGRPRSITPEEYKRMKDRTSASASVLLDIQSMIEPGKKHHLEQMVDEHEDEDDDGDPPDPDPRRVGNSQHKLTNQG